MPDAVALAHTAGVSNGNRTATWRWASLEELIDRIQYGSSAKTSEDSSGIPVLRMGNIINGALDLTELKYLPIKHEEFPGLLLEPGDLLFNRTNSAELVGKSAVYKGTPQPCSFASYLIRVRLKRGYLPTLLAHYLNSPHGRTWVKSVVSQQVGQANVNGTKLRALRVPVPPLDEQQRIVAEIEKQFTRLEAGVASLKRVQTALKRYRASVLKAACEGRLVPTEEEWEQVSLRELIGKISQGWSPKCDPTRDALPHEWAIVTTTAVQSMRYIDNQGKPLPLTLEPRPEIEIKAGDFLMTRKGPRRRAGVACLVRSTRPRLMVCDTVYRFRCNEPRVTPTYLELALNCPAVTDAIDRQKAGINESGVSLTHGKLGGVLIPVPPFAEQQRIVAEVERRLSVIEELEAVAADNLQRAVRLRQSILHRAFSA